MFDIKSLDEAYSPEDQLHIALGIHPDQLAMQDSVADALQKYGQNGGDTGTPESNGVPRLLARPKDAEPAAASESNGVPRLLARPKDAATPAASTGSAAASTGSAALNTSGSGSPMAIARPGNAATRAIQIPGAADDQITKDQAEVQRLHDTGSGISQIKNRPLRILARIGDTVGTILAPTVAAAIPGTEMHHRVLLGDANDKVSTDLGQAKQAADIGEQQARTQALTDKPDAPPKPFFDQAGELIGFQVGDNMLGPKSPQLTQDMKDMMAAAKGKPPKDASPAVQTFNKLITGDPEHGIAPLSHMDALKQVNEANAKPDTATQHKEAFEGALNKAILAAGGNLPKGLHTNMQVASDFINQSKALTPEEKSAAQAFMATNSTPMSGGSTARIRIEGMMQGREYPVIDSKTGNLVMANAEQINGEPGRYQPAAQGGKDMQKQALINDIRGAAQNLKKNMNVMDDNTWQTLKLASAIADPSTTAGSWLQSIPRGSLNDEQSAFVNDLFTLRENAMAMRSVLGSGSSAEDARRAIINTLPGPNTPNAKFGNQQIDNILKTLERVEKGLPTNTAQRGGTDAKKDEGKPKKTGNFGFVEDGTD